MRNSKKVVRLALLVSVLLLLSALTAPAWAADEGNPAGEASKFGPLGYVGAALGAGLVVVGAGMGIGRFAAAAAEGVARQPQAANQITGAVQLPLFLLEGVAIIAVVTCLLIVLLK